MAPHPIAGRVAVALAACSLLLAGARAEEPDDTIRLPVVKHVLDNGMRILLVPWGDAPVVATYLQFDVGGVDDPSGRTGMAHLLEHMMFKGTKTLGTTDWEAERPVFERLRRQHEQHERAVREGADAATLATLEGEIAATTAEHAKFVVKDELWQLYMRCGGTGLNASTGNDSTQYYVTLPSNQLAVWAFCEADRIANPVFREFWPERDVVHEERRMRVDSNARGRFQEAFDAHSYIAHPYRQPVIGWPADIDGMQHDEVMEYFTTWYAPNNCVAVLVGDLDVEATIALMTKHFGPIPAQPLPRRGITREPRREAETRFSMKLDSQKQLTIAWHVPEYGHDDSAALTVASRVLGSGFGGGRRGRFGRGGGGGNTSRFAKRLVEELKVADRASARVSFGRYPGLFTVTASPSRDTSFEELERAVVDEVARLTSEPPTEDELLPIRNSIEAAEIRSLTSSTGIARTLANAELRAGDWRAAFTERRALRDVTAEDVARVMKTYFTEKNRVVGVLNGTDERPGPDNVETDG